ncbi:hypothetical protein J5N97_013616 [Dioscorea zingiberensis]|uniref:Uncharacterized protein n=1 Tax=Dioscorea zingiberensis TaxID=325984 RepID=A0A9D5CSF9_9LILI|nr:hypothetical protein J5N97_013616 [Dioscorea zingiberensis]
MNLSATPTKNWFLDWQFENYEKELLMGNETQQQRQRLAGAADLLQNCDLPPPIKFFSPPIKFFFTPIFLGLLALEVSKQLTDNVYAEVDISKLVVEQETQTMHL